MSNPPPTPPPAAAPATPVASPSRARAAGGPGLLIAAVVVVLLAGAAVAAFLLQRPTLVFANRLAGPVRLTVNESTSTVAPGDTVRARLPRGFVTLQWSLVRPLSADNQPMGEEVKGSWAERDPRGTIERVAAGRTDGGDYFAPLVTNATDGLLRVTVNAGLAGARDCGCAVRPGATRVFIGYYRLYRNSTVRATDSEGRSATFTDLGSEAAARGGSVGLRFTPDAFGRPR